MHLWEKQALHLHVFVSMPCAGTAKPAPYRVTTSLLAASSVVRGARKPKDAGQLEALLADAKFCMSKQSSKP